MHHLHIVLCAHPKSVNRLFKSLRKVPVEYINAINSSASLSNEALMIDLGRARALELGIQTVWP